MAHLQSRAMPQERDLLEHGTTLSLCVKVGKAAVADADLDGGRGGGGGGIIQTLREGGPL